MSRKKKLVKAAKVLGGLGAAYVANEFANPTTIDLGLPLRRDEEAAPASPPEVVVPAAPAVEAPLRSRVVIPDFDRDTRDPGLFGVGKKKGGAVSASRRGDGVAQRGKTRGKMV